MFQNRETAGRRLADQMHTQGVSPDIVLAVPRGGLPIGRAVADSFGVPLDIVAAKKLGAPANPELAIGAAASDGSVWLNEDLIDRLGIRDSYVESERERAAMVAREKVETYRQSAPPDLDGKRVAVVDDGVATGATIRACLAEVENADASEVILGIPVGPPDTLASLADTVDTLVAVERPTRFGAVGAHYREFDQVSDEEAMAYLRPRDTKT